MALTGDQKAMLRLLAQREEGYEDIAALKGVGVDEIRAQVKAAIAALDDEAVAAGPVAAEEAPGLARPDTSPPTPPAEERGAAAPRPRAPAAPPRPKPATPRGPSFLSRVKLPRDRRRLIELGGGGLIALLLILFVTGTIDIGGGGDDSSSGGGANAGGQLTAAEEEKLTQARLRPPDGGDASGRAIFGRVGKEEVALQVTAQDLEPNAEGESYSVWLYRTPKLALQVGAAKVEQGESLAARFPLPAELLAYVASGAFPQVYVSRTDDAALERQLKRAQKENDLPGYSGETVLRGKIVGPIPDAGRKAREQE